MARLPLYVEPLARLLWLAWVFLVALRVLDVLVCNATTAFQTQVIGVLPILAAVDGVQDN